MESDEARHLDGRAMRIGLLALVLAMAGCAAAPPAEPPYEGGTQTTLTLVRAERGPGAEHCAEMEQATEALEAGRFAEANDLLAAMQARFADLERPGSRLVSFGSQAEYDAFVQTIPDAAAISPVDLCYALILVRQGFAAAAAHDYLTALDHLERAAEASPTMANPHVERGYVLNRLGRPEEARTAYAHGIRLAERHPTSSDQLPIALRGLGYSLIELGRLDEAESAFRRSLELEPGNALAESELRYIEQLRRR